MQHRLTAPEHERLLRDGFLVRERVFSGGDLDAVRSACETLVAGLVGAGEEAAVVRACDGPMPRLRS